jgi:hypothetical protein
VEIADLGERYRVRVMTPGGPVERTYADPARDCQKRARFAAEFVLITLLPPLLAIPGLATERAADAGSGPAGSAPAEATAEAPPAKPPLVTAPATPSPPRPARTGAPSAKSGALGNTGSVRRRPSIVGVELGAAGYVSPTLLGAPAILAGGVDLRSRVGPGRLAGVVGAAFVPAEPFGAPGFRGTILRIPGTAGVRLRWTRSAFEVSGDLTLGAAFERYAGQSPHTPAAAARVTPEAAAAVTGSLAATPAFGAFLRLQWEFAPWQQSLAALPNPSLANTPAVWVSAVVGVSLER